MEHLIYAFCPVFWCYRPLGLYMFFLFLPMGAAKQDAGDAKMQGIANHIAEGAMAFLKAEYRILIVYVIIAGIGLGCLSQD